MSVGTVAEKPSTLVVHHLNDSRSQRVLWLLEELEVPYTIKYYQRLPNSKAPSELLDVHPMGKSPVIVDGDLTIAESGPVIEYLLNKYGSEKDRPSEKGMIDDVYWTHFAEGTIMPVLVQKYIFDFIPANSPWYLRFILKPLFNAINFAVVKEDLGRAVQLAAKHLEEHPESIWFAHGDRPTRADYMMLFPLEAINAGYADGMCEVSPIIETWVERVHGRLTYQRALEKGGPYKYY